MAISKASSRKCPVCVGLTKERIADVDTELAPLLLEVKASGEIPKAKDSRFTAIALKLGVAPNSLRYHLKECLIEVEIQDQRFQELIDLTEALKTAKQSYAEFPNMNNASALTSLLTQWRGLADDIEGQTDPSVTIEFLIEAVLSPINRSIISSLAEELRSLRESIYAVVPNNHKSMVDSSVKSAMSSVSSAMRESTDESLRAICEYYRIELESQTRKRAMESTINSTDTHPSKGIVH